MLVAGEPALGGLRRSPGVASTSGAPGPLRAAQLLYLPKRARGITCFAAPASIPRPARERGELPPDGGAAPSVPDLPLKPLPRKVEGVADDPRLHNPLQRLERLGLGWLGVILELDGVCVEYEYGDVAARAWAALAEEEGKPAPLHWALTKAEGMKNEQVIQEVFCWSRNPVEVRRLATRKEALLEEQLGDRKPMVPSGVTKLLETLQHNGAPVALVSAAPERRVLPTLEQAGLSGRFQAVITGDDVQRGKPDPEGYLYAAQRLERPPARCVVVGNSNLSVEAAHEVGMQCVAVAGRHPVYELTAADLVVRDLGDLSFLNLKKLFAAEEAVAAARDEEEGLEMEEEDDPTGLPALRTQVIDRW